MSEEDKGALRIIARSFPSFTSGFENIMDFITITNKITIKFWVISVGFINLYCFFCASVGYLDGNT
jgi:hypothetical protein